MAAFRLCPSNEEASSSGSEPALLYDTFPVCGAPGLVGVLQRVHVVVYLDDDLLVGRHVLYLCRSCEVCVQLYSFLLQSLFQVFLQSFRILVQFRFVIDKSWIGTVLQGQLRIDRSNSRKFSWVYDLPGAVRRVVRTSQSAPLLVQGVHVHFQLLNNDVSVLFVTFRKLSEHIHEALESFFPWKSYRAKDVIVQRLVGCAESGNRESVFQVMCRDAVEGFLGFLYDGVIVHAFDVDVVLRACVMKVSFGVLLAHHRSFQRFELDALDQRLRLGLLELDALLDAVLRRAVLGFDSTEPMCLFRSVVLETSVLQLLLSYIT